LASNVIKSGSSFSPWGASCSGMFGAIFGFPY
jgi:hypothetical protein